MNKPRILFINRSYWPDAEATGQLLTELCEYLSDDFEIHVIVGQPNSNPGNQAYKKSGKQEVNKVHVHRVWHSQFNKSSGAGRLLNLLTFFFSAMIRTFFLPRMQIVVMETDPFLLPLGSNFIRLSHRSKMVYYLQDIYPDIAIAVNVVKNSWLMKLLRVMLFRNYRRAEAVIVLSRDMKNLCLKYGISEKLLHIIPNWCNVEELLPRQQENQLRREYVFQEKIIIMHSGNMGMSQDLEKILQVAKIFQDMQITHVHFMLTGGGAREQFLKNMANELRLANLTFHPYQPRKMLAESLSSADIHIISSNDQALECLMPCKLYGILSCGAPVFGIINPSSELAEIIVRNHCGEVVSGSDPHLIAATLLKLVNHAVSLNEMRMNARKYAVANCDLKHSGKLFNKLFRNLLTPSHNKDQAA